MSIEKRPFKAKDLPKGASLCAAYINVASWHSPSRCRNLVYEQKYCHKHRSTKKKYDPMPQLGG